MVAHDHESNGPTKPSQRKSDHDHRMNGDTAGIPNRGRPELCCKTCSRQSPDDGCPAEVTHQGEGSRDAQSYECEELR